MKTHHKYILFLSCFLLFLIRSQAQNAKIDSLKKELLIHKKKDTIRVNLLNELAFSYFSSDMPKTLEYLQEADSITKVIIFVKGKARSTYIKGITEAIQSNYDQAVYYYNEALKIYKTIDFKQGIANCYNAIGVSYKNKGDKRKAILYLKKAINIEEKIGGKNLSAALINLGAIYQDLGEFEKAIPPLKKALSIAQANENKQRVAYSLNNLGTIYKEQGNYPLALEYYKKSMYINEKIKDVLGISNNLYNMGEIYKTQKYFDLAISCYKKSLKIHERTNNKRGIASLLNAIGTILEENKSYRSALEYYTNALNLSEQIDSKREIPFILNNIGGIYLALNDYETANQYFTKAEKISLEIESKLALCGSYIGLAKSHTNEKDYNSALTYALKAKEVSNKSGFLNDQKEVLEILSNIYKKTGDYKNALENHEQFKILNDSLFNKENIEKITQLEYEYQYKQVLDSASIRELKLTNEVKATSQNLSKTQRNYLWAIIGVLLVSMTLGAVIFFQKLRNAKTKTENAMIEQKLLRSQMTPHFIFNSLSVLQGMILNKEAEKAVHYLSKFSKLMRITLENSRDKTVSLEDELTAIQNYLELQNLENEVYEYTILVDEAIDIPKFKIPPMLIQPFVENAIEHAFVNQKEHRKIDIRLTFQENKLICTVSDNGIGVSFKKEHKAQTKKSLATTITSERLKMLSKDLKMFGSVMVEDRKKYGEQGTVVTLQIPHKTLAAS